MCSPTCPPPPHPPSASTRGPSWTTSQPPPVSPPVSPPSPASVALACSSYRKGHSAAGNLILSTPPPPPPGLLLSPVRCRWCHRDSMLSTQSHTAREGQSHGARFQCLSRGRGEPRLCLSTLSPPPSVPGDTQTPDTELVSGSSSAVTDLQLCESSPP